MNDTCETKVMPPLWADDRFVAGGVAHYGMRRDGDIITPCGYQFNAFGVLYGPPEITPADLCRTCWHYVLYQLPWEAKP